MTLSVIRCSNNKHIGYIYTFNITNTAKIPQNQNFVSNIHMTI